MTIRRAMWRLRRAPLAHGALAFFVVALVACADRSALPRNTQTADGITINTGVVPAELVKGHAIDQHPPGD